MCLISRQHHFCINYIVIKMFSNSFFLESEFLLSNHLFIQQSFVDNGKEPYVARFNSNWNYCVLLYKIMNYHLNHSQDLFVEEIWHKLLLINSSVWEHYVLKSMNWTPKEPMLKALKHNVCICIPWKFQRYLIVILK